MSALGDIFSSMTSKTGNIIVRLGKGFVSTSATVGEPTTGDDETSPILEGGGGAAVRHIHHHEHEHVSTRAHTSRSSSITTTGTAIATAVEIQVPAPPRKHTAAINGTNKHVQSNTVEGAGTGGSGRSHNAAPVAAAAGSGVATNTRSLRSKATINTTTSNTTTTTTTAAPPTTSGRVRRERKPMPKSENASNGIAAPVETTSKPTNTAEEEEPSAAVVADDFTAAAAERKNLRRRQAHVKTYARTTRKHLPEPEHAGEENEVIMGEDEQKVDELENVTSPESEEVDMDGEKEVKAQPPPAAQVERGRANARKRTKKNAEGLEVEEQPRKRQRSNNCEPNATAENSTNPAASGGAPATNGTTTEKRILRSQEKGARNKTILDTYFPWIDEEWAQEAKQNEYVGLNTPMHLNFPPSATTSSRRKRSASPPPTSSSSSQIPAPPSPDRKRLRIRLSKPPLPPPPTFPTFDFSAYDPQALTYTSDPLPNSHFQKSHRRMEVSEKRLRNIERERVAHEISRLESQLEMLRGADWLKGLGFERTYGMSAEERARLANVRDEVVAELEGIMHKYKFWREDEKRKRRRDDRRKKGGGGAHARAGSHTPEPARSPTPEAPPSPPTPAAIPVTPARPTHHHTHSNLNPGGGKTPKHVEQIKKMQETPFVSFYKKPHLRAAAMAQNSRRSTRNLTAFGVPLPSFPEREFTVPEEMVEEVEGRRRRRGRRR